MSKADKRKIEELQAQVRREKKTVSAWQSSYLGQNNTIEALQEKLQQEKEKYAQLLEKYISMMERTARIDEQRETD